MGIDYKKKYLKYKLKYLNTKKLLSGGEDSKNPANNDDSFSPLQIYALTTGAPTLPHGEGDRARVLERIDFWPANCRSTTGKNVLLKSNEGSELFNTSTPEGYLGFTNKIVEGQYDLYSKGISMPNQNDLQKINIEFEMGPVLTKNSERHKGVIITPYTVSRNNKPISLGIADKPKGYIPKLTIELNKDILEEIELDGLLTDVKVTINSTDLKNCNGLGISVSDMVVWIKDNAVFFSEIYSQGAKERDGYRASFLTDFFGGLQVLSALYWCWSTGEDQFTDNFNKIFDRNMFVPSIVKGNDPDAEKKVGLSNDPFDYFALIENNDQSEHNRPLYIVNEEKGNEIGLMNRMADMMQNPQNYTDFFKNHINIMCMRHDAGVNDFDDDLFIYWVVTKLGLNETILEQISIRKQFWGKFQLEKKIRRIIINIMKMIKW